MPPRRGAGLCFPLLFAALTGRSGHGLAERLAKTLTNCRLPARPLTEIASTGRIAYDESWLVRDAANYNLSVLGEALNNLSAEFVARNPQIPVRQAKTLRNKLPHEYWEADSDILWDTIANDVPALQSALEAASAGSASHEPMTKLNPLFKISASRHSKAFVVLAQRPAVDAVIPLHRSAACVQSDTATRDERLFAF